MMESTPTEDTLCDELCLEALPTKFCPLNLALPNCLEVGLGEVCVFVLTSGRRGLPLRDTNRKDATPCEANGECGTDDKLNNCGTCDISDKVLRGFATPN